MLGQLLDVLLLLLQPLADVDEPKSKALATCLHWMRTTASSPHSRLYVCVCSCRVALLLPLLVPDVHFLLGSLALGEGITI